MQRLSRPAVSGGCVRAHRRILGGAGRRRDAGRQERDERVDRKRTGTGTGTGPGSPDEKEAHTFEHEKLDVYKVAIEFAGRADEIVGAIPRGRRHLADQLQRASTSIVLNIAEGAGKYSKLDKAAYYTRARGSTMECAAILDIGEKVRIMKSAAVAKDKAVLDRIDRMLTKLIKALQSNSREAPAPEVVPPGPGPVPGPVFLGELDYRNDLAQTTDEESDQ